MTALLGEINPTHHYERRDDNGIRPACKRRICAKRRRLDRAGICELSMQQLSLFPDLPVPRKFSFDCLDCGVHTRRIDEFYMVTNEVWNSVCTNPSDANGMLCVGCIERRLGRTLKPDDFPDCLVNTDHVGFRKSERLLERLHWTATVSCLPTCQRSPPRAAGFAGLVCVCVCVRHRATTSNSSIWTKRTPWTSRTNVRLSGLSSRGQLDRTKRTRQTTTL
jgi:hypothetical protein